MRLLLPPLSDASVLRMTPFSACTICISAHHSSTALRPLPQRLFTRRRMKCRSHKQAVVCFQHLNLGLGNVSETLQQIGDRFAKNEHVARFGGFLKGDNGGRENSQGALEAMNTFWEASNLPFPKRGPRRDSREEDSEMHADLDFPFVVERTFDASTPGGELSAAAISCIEQFSRMNGDRGSHTIQSFHAECPVSIQNDARHIVEYCCFKYLSRCRTEVHPLLKDAAFSRLIFITMLAWQEPYASAQNHAPEHEKSKGQIVGEKAFSRIAPTVPGVADRPTAHYLFEALTTSKEGLSFSVWETYLSELCRVHEERSDHRLDEGSSLNLDAEESVLCVGSDKRRPVQMWNSNNIAWPGRLTMTDRALYFEPNGMFQHQKAARLDLTGGHGSVERQKVGPLGAPVFDSAITIMSDAKSERWTLEFVDFSGGGRREVWFSFIDEMISTYAFISEYGPGADDSFGHYVRGSQNGNKKAIASAVNGIARVQAVQSTLNRVLEYPSRLLQFSRLKNAPCGDLVKQTLAVCFWGGYVDANHKDSKSNSNISDTFGTGFRVTNVDGSVYPQRWMRLPTWKSPTSSSFWKHKAGGKGLVLGKDLVVGDLTYVERAVKAFKDQSQMLERTKATIDGALVKGIPSNIDLLKELMLPLTVLSMNLKKLQKWEHPPSTAVFLAVCSLVLYKRWLKFFVPVVLLIAAVLVFTVHNMRSQGRLGDSFGKVVIREQPPSNTLQKIIALKEALAELEIQIQKANIALLKLRSLALAGHPQGRNMVAFGLVAAGLTLMFVPFRYVFAFILLDQFTCELDFRRGMVHKFFGQAQAWWDAIPATSVVVLPHEKHQNKDGSSNVGSQVNESTKGEVITKTVREWVAESF